MRFNAFRDKLDPFQSRCRADASTQATQQLPRSLLRDCGSESALLAGPKGTSFCGQCL